MPYGTDQGLIDYLALTGRSLPVGADTTVMRQFGSMYVNMFEAQYRGVAIALPDSFPRDIYNPVPVSVEYAAYEAALAYADGVELFGTGGTNGGQVIREKLDVMEVQYAEPQSSSGFYENNLFIWPLAYAYLKPYMRNGRFTSAAFVVTASQGNCGC